MKDIQIQVLLNVLYEVTKRYDEIFLLKERLLEETSFKSTHDVLTSLYNRSYFENRVQKLIINEEQFIMAFMDLDNFKYENDTFGHILGDEVLIQTAKILKDNLKGKDIVARFGGDEFVMCLPSCDVNSAVKIMNNIKNIIKKTFKYYNISVSIGIASYPENPTYEEVLKKADENMYKSKKKGKDSITF